MTESLPRNLPRWAGLACLVLLLTSGVFGVGCTSLPTDYPKTATTALADPMSTGAGALFERQAARHPGKSGFAVIEGNREAFTDRAALAAFAEKTLDIQDDIWASDTVGKMLAEKILEAADRGVRVRFLLDDMVFTKRDGAAAAFSAHPNIEVRIFNPHRNRGIRALELVANFGRLNKRMHNKIMVMDNTCAVIGGRNIANEDFGLGEEQNNRDLDIVAVGPVVREVSETFDEFWNSDAAIPIEALAKKAVTMEGADERAAVFKASIDRTHYPYPLDTDLAALRKRIEGMRTKLVWADGRVLHDPFESMATGDLTGTVIDELYREMQGAKSELFIESAYFVLRDPGIEFAGELEERGVDLRILTNSLASNNVLAAQAGHAKRRKKLLQAGATLYELRPDSASTLAEVVVEGKDAITTLHTKAVVIDGEKAFVGSFNLDPRSAEINSEIGLFVESPEFAGQVRDFLNQGIQTENAYQVTLGERGRLQWSTVIDGEPRTWSKDPETSALRRFTSFLISLLPIESQL